MFHESGPSMCCGSYCWNSCHMAVVAAVESRILDVDTFFDADDVKWRAGRMEDRCIMCGTIIPEGQQVCKNCTLKIKGDMAENHYRDVIEKDERKGENGKSAF